MKHALELRDVLEEGLADTPTAPWRGLLVYYLLPIKCNLSSEVLDINKNFIFNKTY